MKYTRESLDAVFVALSPHLAVFVALVLYLGVSRATFILLKKWADHRYRFGPALAGTAPFSPCLRFPSFPFRQADPELFQFGNHWPKFLELARRALNSANPAVHAKVRSQSKEAAFEEPLHGSTLLPPLPLFVAISEQQALPHSPLPSRTSSSAPGVHSTRDGFGCEKKLTRPGRRRAALFAGYDPALGHVREVHGHVRRGHVRGCIGPRARVLC